MEMRPPLEIDDYDDMNVCDRDGRLVAEYIINAHDRDYIISAVNACHRLGLTAEQLDAGVIDNLVASIRPFLRSACRPYDDGKYDDLYDKARNNLRNALVPFTKESRDEKAE